MIELLVVIAIIAILAAICSVRAKRKFSAMKKLSLFLLAILMAAMAASSSAADSHDSGSCFLRNGERWLLIGDSITDNGTYCRMIIEVFKHFHPEANVAISGNGVSGVSSDFKFSIDKEKPTLVSIMLGMNDIIHFGYKKRNMDEVIASYRKNITAKVRQYREMGADVVLMTPTLTDEAYSRFFWELRGSREDLKKLGQTIREIAEQEKVFYIPIQEEMEAYRSTRETVQSLWPDGVHPSAAGQYQIARSFWEHMNFSGPLLAADKPRSLSTSFEPVPVKISVNSKFICSETPALELKLQSEQPVKVQLQWNLGKLSGKTELDVDPKGIAWSPNLPEDALEMKSGQLRQLIFDLQSDKSRSLYVVDLNRNPVLHFKDNKITGELLADRNRLEGKTVMTWAIEKMDEGMLFSGEVYDNDIECNNSWPWGRDNVSLWLDLRKGDHYGDIGLDEDVFMNIISVQEKPAFSCHLIPWLGRGMDKAANVGGSKTDKGWKWHMYINHAFLENNQLVLKDHDYIGFNMNACDEDKTAGDKYKSDYFQLHKTDYPMDIYPNGMMILDLKDKLKGDAVTLINLWGR